MYKVVIVDDEFRTKERLLNLTNWADTQFNFCGEASDGDMGLSLINELKPDIVIMDIEMPFMNGLELTAILKSSMPWIEIILLSGHDEFEYAQEAMKLGVSEYLLKPIDLDKLSKVLNDVVKKIEDEKEKEMKLFRMESKLQDFGDYQKDYLFESIILNNYSTREIIEKYNEYNFDIIKKFYVVMDIKICSDTGIDFVGIKALCNRTLKRINNILYYYRIQDKLTIILADNDRSKLMEQAFAVAGIMKYEIGQFENHNVIIGIGNAVDRLRSVCHSYANANKARSYVTDMYIGHILYYEDVEKNMIEVNNNPDNLIVDELLYMNVQDIDGFIDRCLDAQELPGIYKFYQITRVMFECANIVKKYNGEPTDVLPYVKEKDIITLARFGDEESRIILKDFIERTIKFRQENAQTKYSDILKKAKDFINVNYSKPSISLNSVAQHVALSPNHFSAIFSNETKETFIEYLTKIRINHAKKLLLETEKKLSDISYDVGYNEPQYFSYIFKKNMLVSPSDYRKRKL
jgi:two-component system, response regulator YesN